MSKVLGIVYRVISIHLVRSAGLTRDSAHTGAVTLIQRFGSARNLSDVAKTMARVQRDLPQAEASVLPDCSYFLQEDQPAEVAWLLAAFFAD